MTALTSTRPSERRRAHHQARLSHAHMSKPTHTRTRTPSSTCAGTQALTHMVMHMCRHASGHEWPTHACLWAWFSMGADPEVRARSAQGKGLRSMGAQVMAGSPVVMAGSPVVMAGSPVVMAEAHLWMCVSMSLAASKLTTALTVLCRPGARRTKGRMVSRQPQPAGEGTAAADNRSQQLRGRLQRTTAASR